MKKPAVKVPNKKGDETDNLKAFGSLGAAKKAVGFMFKKKAKGKN